jgi:hypothetical protein
MNKQDLKHLIKEELAKSNLKGNSNHNQFELLGRKISGRYSNRFDITKSEQFITIDVGGFNINIVSDASNDMVFVEMDSDWIRIILRNQRNTECVITIRYSK